MSLNDGTLFAILDHLETHLAAARAAKIDNVDTTTTSRASSSNMATVLSDLATLLASIDATITSRASSSNMATALSNLSTLLGRVTSNVDANVSTRAAATNPVLRPPSAAKVKATDSVTSSTTVTIHSYTGAGVLHYAFMFVSVSTTGEISVEIDGVAYIPTTAVAASATDWVVGDRRDDNAVEAGLHEDVPFLTSLVIKGRRPTGTGIVTAGYSYRKTS